MITDTGISATFMGKQITVAASEISHLEADSKYVFVYYMKTANNGAVFPTRLLVSESIAQILAAFPGLFVRTHRAHAVALAKLTCFVKQLDRIYAAVEGSNRWVPVSRRMYSSIRHLSEMLK